MPSPLNELTPKEWVKFQKSWFIYDPPPRDAAKILHPAPFPEELAAEFIKFFTRKGMWVLDPMVGSGSTLIACAMTGRNGIGIELSPYWAKVAETRLNEFKAQRNLFEDDTTKQRIIVADARNIDQIDMPLIDYVLTSPPYWDVLKREGNFRQKARRAKGLPLYYSDDPRDLGNIEDYDQFLTELVGIYRKVADKMRQGAYMTIIIRNVKKGARLYPLAWDLALRLGDFLELMSERIWCQNDQKLNIYGYPTTWVSNTMHHYSLIFRKP